MNFLLTENCKCASPSFSLRSSHQQKQTKMADSGLFEKASYVPRPPAVLFYHKSMSQLAESICERCSHALKSPIVTQVGHV